MKLRLILGDQLNLQHSWFEMVDQEVTYILMDSYFLQSDNLLEHHYANLRHKKSSLMGQSLS